MKIPGALAGLGLCLSSIALAQTGTDDLKAFGIPTGVTVNAGTKAAPSNALSTGNEHSTIYGGDPVDIILGVGKTLRLVFDFVGHIGVPADMAQQIDIKTLPSGIFLTATAPFEAAVVQVRNADNTRVIPLYLSAVGSADPAWAKVPDRITVVDSTIAAPSPPPPPVVAKAPERVVVTPPQPATPKTPPLRDSVAQAIPRARTRTNTGLIDFVRMLAQAHYGPPRLANTLSGAEPVSVDTASTVRLIPGARVETTPVVSYSYRNYIGTAVEILNPGDTEFAIDPRQFVGYWRYAAVLDRRSVIGAGERAIVYLISDRPFEQALRGVVYRGAMQ